MNTTTPLRRHLPQGQVVAGAAVVIGLAATAGLLCAGDAHDLRSMAASGAAGDCSIRPLASAAY